MDWIPVISQVKSLVQASLGDVEGARITQENFSRECPGISQVRSAVEAIGGDEEAARQTQMQFVGNLNDFVDSIPVVGHTKGAIHYIAGDNNGGDNAMKAASRTAGVMAAGAGGFLVGGPAGAVAGGMAGGVAMDGIITGVDSGVHNQYHPYGIVENVERLKANPGDTGQWFDTLVSPAFDGLIGYETLGTGNKLQNHRKYNAIRNQIGDVNARMVTEASEAAWKVREAYPMKKNIPQVTSVVNADTAMSVGHNKQYRNAMKIPNPFEGEQFSRVQILAEENGTAGRPPIRRDPKSCAEHHAYQTIPREEIPGSKVSTVEYRRNMAQIVAKQRCANCLHYAAAMGECLTDVIDKMPIPRASDLHGSVMGPFVAGVCVSCGRPLSNNDLWN